MNINENIREERKLKKKGVPTELLIFELPLIISFKPRYLIKA